MTTGGNAGWGERIPGFLSYIKKVAISAAIDGQGNWNFYTLPLTLGTLSSDTALRREQLCLPCLHGWILNERENQQEASGFQAS